MIEDGEVVQFAKLDNGEDNVVGVDTGFSVFGNAEFEAREDSPFSGFVAVVAIKERLGVAEGNKFVGGGV